MPLQIAVSDQILLEALDIEDEERQFIESVKENEQVDDIIDAGGQKLAQQLSGLAANRGSETRKERGEHIVATLDVAIALIALAENVEEVERLKKIATLLGRQHKKVITINELQIWPALRRTFQQTARELEVGTTVRLERQRAFTRRKIRAAIKIINESLANKQTHWE